MTATQYFIVAALTLGIVLTWWIDLKLWPTFEAERPVRGLGDVVAIVLTSLGVSGWEGCGCDERRERWNERWPRRWYATARLEEQLKAQAWRAEEAREALQAVAREFEAFRVHALGALSIFHERLVKRESGDHAWYVAGIMGEVVPFLTENNVGARTIAQANPSSLRDDSQAALEAQDEAVEPRDYTSRR